MALLKTFRVEQDKNAEITAYFGCATAWKIEGLECIIVAPTKKKLIKLLEKMHPGKEFYAEKFKMVKVINE